MPFPKASNKMNQLTEISTGTFPHNLRLDQHTGVLIMLSSPAKQEMPPAFGSQCFLGFPSTDFSQLSVRKRWPDKSKFGSSDSFSVILMLLSLLASFSGILQQEGFNSFLSCTPPLAVSNVYTQNTSEPFRIAFSNWTFCWSSPAIGRQCLWSFGPRCTFLGSVDHSIFPDANNLRC